MLDFHNHTNEAGEVLILRRIPADRITKNGFVWPSGVGTVVECPDWQPTNKCGHGLHGWPWGFGLGEGCDYDIIGDIWLVVGAKPEDVIGDLEGGAKCKFRCGIIRLEGNFGDAMNTVRDGFAECVEAASELALQLDKSTISESVQTGNSSKAAANGNSSNAAANGNSSNAAANGNSSKAAANGNSSNAAANGNSSNAAANGNSSNAAANGNSSNAAANGDYSNAAANGNYSRAAANGDYSRAAANGNYSRAAANGNSSKAAANGEDTLSVAIGHDCRVCVGKRGAFALPYYTEADGWRFLCGKVGENGITADTWYEIKHGQLRNCDCHEAVAE